MINKSISKKIQILFNQFKTRNYEIVISKGNILLKENPEYVVLYNLVGSAYQNTGNYINAKNNFKNGLKLDPNNLALLNNLAMSHKNLLQYQLAEELYFKIIELNKNYVNAYVNLGNLKRDLNEFTDAIKLYEKALSISDHNPVIYYSLALAHQGIGNFEKTILYSQKTLSLDPNFTRADHLISQSTKYVNHNEHYLSLKNKIDNFKNYEKVDLYFSLAKAEEDLENIKDAADFLIKGNALKKKLTNYNITDELNLSKHIYEKFNSLKIENFSTKKSSKIIFILGMPRSGTSLVEQIITSHSEVFGGGELPILSNIIKNIFIKNNNSIIENFDEAIQDQSIIDDCRSQYLDFIKNFKFKEKYITDKAPLNFRWIGFIKLIFPDAKIIHCIRNPKNNCLSMFKNLFEGGLNFTYDQEDLVKYYNQYLNLMKFWKSKYPNSIFDVKYENLISDKDKEIKKIIQFSGLAWEESCLSFHNNKNPIKTMSSAQARIPIYKSSLNTFDKFRDFLTILEKKL
jgi:tetratricopeptide (TPR) repeat protein